MVQWLEEPAQRLQNGFASSLGDACAVLEAEKKKASKWWKTV